MNEAWSAALFGLGLAATSAGYYLARQASLSGSGQVSRVVDAVWKKKQPDDELMAALMAASAERFGADEVERARKARNPRRSRQVTLPETIVFLLALALGGLLAQGTRSVKWELDPEFTRLIALPSAEPAVLLAAGLLVGFGARLAGGCTTGHSLVGVSQLQKGSLLSTVVFFATGVAVTLFIR
jgi:Sulphur transport